MARAEATITPLPRAGLAVATAPANPAVVDGLMFTWSDKRMIRIKNTDAAPKTVTLVIPGAIDGQEIPDRDYIIPATIGDVLIPPLPAVYRHADGKVWINFSAITGVSVAVYELPA
ncbi:hypothetical protein ACIBG7_12705 [Nonomuraea sp. NPDC050328]|uniref:hypothetical protein n=1 Tax=Nonomuraea sp. NPDC050328 TaxID=3364361 RepID=UPI00378CB67E